MSEYQYYEFQTVDRRLSEPEMQELRSLSTRAVITPTSFANEYSYGSFKGQPDAMMEQYFDGFLYLANWGTHQLQLALPARLLARETAQQYCYSEAASVREKKGKVILTFLSEDDEGGGWVEGEGLLSGLLPLRKDLAEGDLRSLYIGWLLGVQSRELGEEEAEPPVPPNLKHLSGPLSDLMDFLRLDPDLLAVAAEASAAQSTQPASREALAAWVAQLPTSEKDEVLLRVLAGEEVVLGPELRSRFHRSRPESPAPEPPRRTAGQLLAAAETYGEQRQRQAARQAAEEKAQQAQLAAEARQRHLKALAGREPELWAQVEELVSTKLPKSYDVAVQHLLDLRDLAARAGAGSDFGQRLAQLRERHGAKRTFLKRLQQKGL
jgi:hypothetical protein